MGWGKGGRRRKQDGQAIDSRKKLGQATSSETPAWDKLCWHTACQVMHL
jgi:hypothetical protein